MSLYIFWKLWPTAFSGFWSNFFEELSTKVIFFHRAFNESHLAYHLRECFCVWHPQISCFPSIVKSTIARRQCFCPLFGIEFGQKKIKCTFCVGSPSFFSDVCHTGVDYVSVQALQWRKPTDFNIGQVLDPAQHVLVPPQCRRLHRKVRFWPTRSRPSFSWLDLGGSQPAALSL